MDFQELGLVIILLFIGYIVGFAHCDIQWYRANKMSFPEPEKFNKE